jgi:hypothetical protein
MPTISNIGAGSILSYSPGNLMSSSGKAWTGAEILSNAASNVITGTRVYTTQLAGSLHNTIVYKNVNLTQKLSNTNFKIGTNYFYADNNGWTVGIHNFNGPGDTYISGPQSILDFRTDNLTIEMFLYAKSLPTWEYSAYLSVGEPKHCERVTGFFSSSNAGVYSYGERRQEFAIDYRQGDQYSKINPGFEFTGQCNEVITHDNDTERPVMNEGFTKEAWHHVALTRYNGTLRLYFNGQLQDLRVKASNCDWKASELINPLCIGTRGERCFSSTGPFYGMWNGYMSDVRVIKTQALYTGATYTVPVRPLTATGHRAGNQNITGEIRLLACQDTLKTIGPTLVRTLVGQ